MFYILIALALAPGVAIMLFIYWRDTHDREPIRHLIVALFLGMAAVLPALLAEHLLTNNIEKQYFDAHSVARKLFKAYVIAAMVEELIKFAVCRLYAYPKKCFDEPLDGIVYMVMVAMGFATVENFMYIFSDKLGGWETGIMRMFLAVPGHACWGVIVGYFMGLAKFKPAGTTRITLMLTGLVLAMLVHGTYDGLIFLEDTATFKDYTYLLAISALLTAAAGYVLSHKALVRHRQISKGLFVLNQTTTNGNATDC